MAEKSPVVGVIASTQGAGEELARRLVFPSFVVGLSANVDLGRQAVDIAVILLPRDDLSILSQALSMRDRLGQPEYVFVVDSTDDAACAALIAVGIGRVIPIHHAPSWLACAAAPLTEIARARAMMRLAKAQIPELPVTIDNGEMREAPRGLFDAERRFRETYLRVLISTTSLRTRAAERARVPYRTFFQILKKLGIESDRQKRASSDVRTNSLR